MLLLLSSSCRTEDMESIQAPPEDTLEANSTLATLMQQTAMNDGSNDNIIDNSNCFNIQLPVTVIVNGIEITVTSEDDYNNIEAIFDEFDDDNDNLTINFPVVIILNDFTEITINNYAELFSYSSNCNGENEYDDDIECLDFQYPITASVFNSNSEVIETITITSDNALYSFIDDIDESDLISLNFPITVIISDDTLITINSLNELENTIELYDDYCDEDDDYDYNDDDCDNCTPTELEAILTNCPNWYVDKLERNGNDYDDLYNGYLFNFFTDNTITVEWSGEYAYGTWTTSGSGNNITITINIPDLPYCNNVWDLHEIQNSSGETKIDLRVGDDDRLRYENNCD